MTADRYMRSMEGCFAGENCLEHPVAAATPDEWQQTLKEAESRLVWTDSTAVVLNPDNHRDRSGRLAPGSVMDFEAVVTTTRRDRDGDIMESSGAVVDPAAVLLWQHVPMLPIGRLLHVTEQSASRVKARLSIADTELGRDAAMLAEFGALKISHGFEPLEFEPLPEGGWHIKRFEIYEISLVSVPSNRDAVITAFSRNKLRCPIMKKWALELYRDRPVQGISATAARRTALAHSRHGDCQCLKSDASAGNDGDSVSTMGARWVARALCSRTSDLPVLKEVHNVVGRIVERLEIEQQLSTTKEFLQQVSL